MTLTTRKIVIGLIIIIFSLVYGYLFFERFLTEEEIVITVSNSEKFGDETGRYLIFTDDEVFDDANNYYHDKHNATDVFNKLQKGRTYTVKVVSFYWPTLPHFRNITEIVNEKFPEMKK
jgi:hypothetical protein